MEIITHTGVIERHMVSGNEVWKINSPKVAMNIFVHKDELFRMNEGLINKTAHFNHVHQYHGQDYGGDQFIDYAINIKQNINRSNHHH